MKNKIIKENIFFQIILYNSSNDLIRFLNSINSLILVNNKINFLLVDQSENEYEYKKVEKIIKDFKILSNNIHIHLDKQPNYGFGKGHNKIFQKYSCSYKDFFIILNPDCILFFDLIQQINKYVKRLSTINWGLLELQQFPSEHPKYYNPKTLETSWASGAGLIINKKAFISVGMFDENIFMYGEDVDLSIRMRRKKFKVIHLPKAQFIHLTKDTDITKESDFTRIQKQAFELYIRYKVSKESDVKKYISLLGENDPHYTEIIELYDEMKNSLKRRIFCKNFIKKNQDYTNFRWVLR